MDPDPEAEQAASRFLKTGFITIVFTACNSYETETTASVSNIQFSLPDSTHKSTTPVVAKKKKKRTVYLTFDDGPNKGSKKVMNIVREEQMPVSMFIIGEHIYGSAHQTATYDSLRACEYIEIANHSFTHAGNQYRQFYELPDSVVHDFRRCADSLQVNDHIVRTPGRNIWRTTTISSTDIKSSGPAADSLRKEGFMVIGWDLEWHYDSQLHLKNTGDEMICQLDSVFCQGRTKTPDHLVLLAHDQVYADATDSASLHAFIKKLKSADEYNFELISRYPGIKN